MHLPPTRPGFDPVIRRFGAMLFLATIAIGFVGCSNPENAVGFEEQDPGARLRAVRAAVATNDRSAVGPLIAMLGSDDPAERLFASNALTKLTGRSFGYDHAASPEQRRAAARRWAEWYAQSDVPAPDTRSMGSAARIPSAPDREPKP